MPKLKFHMTQHAALRIAERGLSLEAMKSVVHYSTDVRELRQGANGGKLKQFRRTADTRVLVVVAEVKGNECWIATGYYED